MKENTSKEESRPDLGRTGKDSQALVLSQSDILYFLIQVLHLSCTFYVCCMSTLLRKGFQVFFSFIHYFDLTFLLFSFTTISESCSLRNLFREGPYSAFCESFHRDPGIEGSCHLRKTRQLSSYSTQNLCLLYSKIGENSFVTSNLMNCQTLKT